MKFVLVVLLMLVAPFSLATTTTSNDSQLKVENAVADSKTEPSKTFQAMNPTAAASAQAAAANSATGVSAAVETAPREWATIEIALSCGLLIFTFLVLALEAFIVVKAVKPWSPQSILRVFGITLILPLSVILIVAGYDKDQIAPVMGLLGVVAGYLLGNSDKPRSSS